MLEMNAGEVFTFAESYLGLRHGPMSAIRPDTLVVAFLSSDPLVRAYERDVLTELDRKGLGSGRVIVGAGVPAGVVASPEALVLECGALSPGRGRGPDPPRRRGGAAPRVLPLPGGRPPPRLAVGGQRHHPGRLGLRDPPAQRGEVTP